jgi:hypothetical protein
MRTEPVYHVPAARNRRIRLGGPSSASCIALREPEVVLWQALRRCVARESPAGEMAGQPGRRSGGQGRGAYWIESNGQSRSSQARTAW